MIKKTRLRSPNLFLFELIIAILFFAIASTICVQLFAKSHNMIEESSDLNFAVSQLTSIAEVCQTSDSKADAIENIQMLYPHITHIKYSKKSVIPHSFLNQSNNLIDNDTDILAIYYDEDKFVCHKADASYAVFISIRDDNSLISCNMAAYSLLIDNYEIIIDHENEHRLIYKLEVKHNVQNI